MAIHKSLSHAFHNVDDLMTIYGRLWILYRELFFQVTQELEGFDIHV